MASHSRSVSANWATSAAACGRRPHATVRLSHVEELRHDQPVPADQRLGLLPLPRPRRHRILPVLRRHPPGKHKPQALGRRAARTSPARALRPRRQPAIRRHSGYPFLGRGVLEKAFTTKCSASHEHWPPDFHLIHEIVRIWRTASRRGHERFRRRGALLNHLAAWPVVVYMGGTVYLSPGFAIVLGTARAYPAAAGLPVRQGRLPPPARSARLGHLGPRPPPAWLAQ
jgi:hypothetical protein